MLRAYFVFAEVAGMPRPEAALALDLGEGWNAHRPQIIGTQSTDVYTDQKPSDDRWRFDWGWALDGSIGNDKVGRTHHALGLT